jgi:hypothetical protein
MIFQKDQRVKLQGKEHHVIICDDEIAVLGKVKRKGDEVSTSYINCGVYPNYESMRDTIIGLEFL